MSAQTRWPQAPVSTPKGRSVPKGAGTGAGAGTKGAESGRGQMLRGRRSGQVHALKGRTRGQMQALKGRRGAAGVARTGIGANTSDPNSKSRRTQCTRPPKKPLPTTPTQWPKLISLVRPQRPKRKGPNSTKAVRRCHSSRDTSPNSIPAEPTRCQPLHICNCCGQPFKAQIG